MILLDLIFSGFLIFGILSGLWNGFFTELASLLSLFVGIYVAFKFSAVLKDILIGHVSWNPETVQAVAFLLTFILVVLGVIVLGKALTAFANFTAFGLINRIAGGVVGFFRMVLMLGVALMIFEKLNEGHTFAKKETLEKSVFYGSILKTTSWIYPSMKSWIETQQKKS
ncbi:MULTISPECIES: CvpA family protein [unclassified Flavobacterium]|uniref:CvpA family protein n=1 Tax=unclassified Flavobacterium TaxID=196869 RepID=UPI0025C14325|nr:MULTISPECIES: CvpA family protein [unclassified Flavobacterium]